MTEVSADAITRLREALDTGDADEIALAARDLLDELPEPCSICNQTTGHAVSCRWG